MYRIDIMACTSCGAGGPGFFAEHFTDAPSSKKTASCPAKDMMNNCLYTAQGMFLCNVDIKGEKKTWGDEQNIEMMQEALREERAFSHTLPWKST